MAVMFFLSVTLKRGLKTNTWHVRKRKVYNSKPIANGFLVHYVLIEDKNKDQ